MTSLLLIGAYCLSCHSDQAKAGGLSLVNFDSTQLEKAEKVIRRLRAGTMPPPKAKQPDLAAAKEFVSALEAEIDARKPTIGSKPASRLNNAEYQASVESLLGIRLDVTSFLPADALSNGFDTIADAQVLSTSLLGGYLRAATEAARLVKSKPTKRYLEQLVDRAYRGFATQQDKDAITRLSETSGFEAAIRAVLVSPKFLYRFDAEGDEALAARLSYFLWSAPPDETLLQLARKRTLSNPAVVEAQVKRLLADKRAEALSKRFAAQWLRLGEMNATSLQASMRRETELFFNAIVAEDQNVLHLLTSPYSFVDDRLAKLYGLPPPKRSGFEKRTMPTERGGILGQASILTNTSLPERTSPVLRGKWVMEVLLGIPPPPPPPNVPSLEDTAKPVVNGVEQTTLQRMERHTRSSACNSCHRMIDPFGIALENFDTTGAWRDTNATSVMYDGRKLNGIDGLRSALMARQDLVLLSFTENLMAYGLGRRIEASDMSTVRKVIGNAASRENRFSAFVSGIVLSPTFLRSQNVSHR